MTKRKIVESCALSLILGAFGSAATMADTGEIGHVPVLYGVNSSAYQYIEDQNMNQIRGSAIDIAFDAIVVTSSNPIQGSGGGAAAAGAAASPPGGLAQAFATATANANGGEAEAGATAGGLALPTGLTAALNTALTTALSN